MHSVQEVVASAGAGGGSGDGSAITPDAIKLCNTIISSGEAVQ